MDFPGNEYVRPKRSQLVTGMYAYILLRAKIQVAYEALLLFSLKRVVFTLEKRNSKWKICL